MIHIHTGGGFSSGLNRKYPNSLNHLDWKAPLRCGVLFCTFSCILFLIGVILTWLGTRRSVHNVFGETVPITGPILLAVGGLMLLLASRQFYLAHIRKKASLKALADKEESQGQTKITSTTYHEDEFSENASLNKKKYHDISNDHDEDAHDEVCEKSPLNQPGYYDHNVAPASCNEPLISGVGYVQSPYLSMAMMIYKDPALTYGPFVSAPARTDTCSPGPAGSSEAGDSRTTSPCDRGVQPAHPIGDTAVLETVSTTLLQPHAASSNFSSASLQQAATVNGQQDSIRIFPSDYLSQYQRNAANPNPANGTISSLPSSTAFMMIRTLELQETI